MFVTQTYKFVLLKVKQYSDLASFKLKHAVGFKNEVCKHFAIENIFDVFNRGVCALGFFLAFGLLVANVQLSTAVYAETGQSKFKPVMGSAEKANSLIDHLPEVLILELSPRDVPQIEHLQMAQSAESTKSDKQKTLSKSQMVSPLKQALKDYRAQRIQQAISGFEQAAEKKSFLARYLLAHIYRTGKGGVVDHRRAYEYYRQITAEFSANDLYHARRAPYIAHAFVQLARYMEDGVAELDIKSDPVLARVLFEKAAHFGDIEGQYQLGRFLIESGKMRNVKLGQRWLTRAAMKNNPKAQAYLGALYWQGGVVTRKKSLALAWIEFARRNATGTVKNQVERLYRAVRFDTSEDVHNRAEFYIGRLRTKYNVLWREAPTRKNTENEILDGIILAEPPKDLDQDQFETKKYKNQMPDAMVRGPENFMDGGPSMGFGFQMYDYGDAVGK